MFMLIMDAVAEELFFRIAIQVSISPLSVLESMVFYIWIYQAKRLLDAFTGGFGTCFSNR